MKSLLAFSSLAAFCAAALAVGARASGSWDLLVSLEGMLQCKKELYNPEAELGNRNPHRASSSGSRASVPCMQEAD